MEANALPRVNDDTENLDGEYSGSMDLNSENGIEVDVKHEIKEEHLDPMVMVDLPLVEFDPIKANDTTSMQIGIAATARLNNQKHSRSTSNVHEQLKHDHAVKRCFKCTDCAFATHYQSNLRRHQLCHGTVQPVQMQSL